MKLFPVFLSLSLCLLFGPASPAGAQNDGSHPGTDSTSKPALPESPGSAAAKGLQVRPEMSPEDAAEALRISKLALINGVPYDQPSTHDTVMDYVKDTYGVPGAVRTMVRALYAEARGKPSSFTFWDRLGSSEAITVMNGNIRLGMEIIFHEDLRYLPCNGCSAWHKIENALLAEITARHDEDGHRFFTLTPTVADFAGPIIAHVLWYPDNGAGALQGFISARTVFATRIGQRVLTEFFLDPTNKKKKGDKKKNAPGSIATQPEAVSKTD